MTVCTPGQLLRHAALLGVGGSVLVSSCILDRDGGLAVGGGGAGTGGGTGAQGGGAQCITIDDCPDPTTMCEEKSCAGGWCGIHPLVQGSTCHENDGQVCDGQGNCVKTEGVDCGDPEECLSSHCVDGVCCDTACDRECESCDQAAPLLGTCSPHGAGNDPESECGPGTCDGASDCAKGDHVFSEEYGESGEQWPIAIAVGPSDEIVLGGYFDGDIDFGGGTRVPSNFDGYVVKFDAAGAYIWDRHYGDTNDEFVRGVVVDSLGNVIVCGHYDGALDIGDGGGEVASAGSYDIFLIKLDPSGNPVWSKRFGDVQWQICRGLAVDSLNNVIMIAELFGSVDFGAGSALVGAGGGDVVVAKYTSDGIYQWAKRYGDALAQDVEEVAVDGSDRIVVVGDFHGTIDFGGGSLSAGGLGYRDIFVARLDPGGGQLFAKDFGDDWADDYAEAVAIDEVHHIVLAGSFEGDIDFGGGIRTPTGSADGFVVRLDGSGTHQWDRTFGSGFASAWAVAIDNSNNVVVGGEFDGQADLGGGNLTSSGQLDVFVAKYAYDGTPLWSANYGNNQSQWLEVLATNSQRHIIVGGHFDGTINFGGTNLSSNGADLYLAILEP